MLSYSSSSHSPFTPRPQQSTSAAQLARKACLHRFRLLTVPRRY